MLKQIIYKWPNTVFNPTTTLFGLLFGLLEVVSVLSLILFTLNFFCFNDPTADFKHGSILLIILSSVGGIAFAVPAFKFLKPLATDIVNNTKAECHISGYYYAGFWKRLAAGFIDLVIFLPIYYGWYFIGKINFFTYELGLWSELLGTIYIIFMLNRYGQTIGKMVLKIKVFKVNGNDVAFAESLKRSFGDILIWILIIVEHIITLTHVNIFLLSNKTYNEICQFIYKASPFGYWLFFLMTLWYASEFITLLFNNKKRAIHDYIAGTILLDLSRNEKKT